MSSLEYFFVVSLKYLILVGFTNGKKFSDVVILPFSKLIYFLKILTKFVFFPYAAKPVIFPSCLRLRNQGRVLGD